MDEKHVIDEFRLSFKPNYIEQDDEERIFRAAFISKIPLIVKGPTGCGKTRFMMVLSYNPGYQSIIKDLKESTKQRFGSLVFGHPSVNVETHIIQTESGLPEDESRKLAELGSKIRELKGFGLDEGVSSRLLVYVGRLIKAGLTPVEASTCAISHTLTDEAEVWSAIQNIVHLYFGDLMENEQ